MDTAKSFKLANGEPIVFTDFQKATEKFRQIEAEALDEVADGASVKTTTTSCLNSGSTIATKKQSSATPMNNRTPVKKAPDHNTSVLDTEVDDGEDIEWDDDDDQMNMSLRDIVQENPAK